MKPLSEEELRKAAEQDWATYEYEEGNLYRTTFFGGYKLGYARCIRQMQDEFDELLKACHTALQNQTNVDINQIINQMKAGVADKERYFVGVDVGEGSSKQGLVFIPSSKQPSNKTTK